MLLLLIEHFVDALPRQKYSSSLLIEPLDDFLDLAAEGSSDCCHPCDAFSVEVLEDSLELEVVKLHEVVFT